MSLANPPDANRKSDHTLHVGGGGDGGGGGRPLKVQPPSPDTAAMADSKAKLEHPTDRQQQRDDQPPSIASQELDSSSGSSGSSAAPNPARH